MDALKKSETVVRCLWNLTASDKEIRRAQSASPLSELGPCDPSAIRDAARGMVAAWLIGMSIDSREWTHEGFQRVGRFTADNDEILSVPYVDRC
jgi:hypothetical protein